MQRLARHLWHLARHGRGMDLRNGNGLVARLLRSALDLGVELRAGHGLAELIMRADRIEEALLDTEAGRIDVHARCGVVLACGGYPHDVARRGRAFPRAQTHLLLAVPSATGDGVRLGECVGGRQVDTLAAPGAWCPVSRVIWPDGSAGVFPQLIDRGKPGVIGVLADGRRFCNVGLGYHDYVREMLKAVPGNPVPNLIEWTHRRATLIAERTERDSLPVYRFDIRLQGEGETVFFDI